MSAADGSMTLAKELVAKEEGEKVALNGGGGVGPRAGG